MYGSHTVEA